MKCIDCKFCAFINKSQEEMTIESNGVETTWFSVHGAYCMKTSCSMIEVTKCSGYEKSKHKKLKINP